MTSQLTLSGIDSPAAAVSAARHYYRCTDCLTVCAVADRLPLITDSWTLHGKCDACGGHFEYMGQVERARLVEVRLQTPCDHRCTDAVGPSCDCRCGGKNHGSHMVVEVIHDRGPVPVVMVHSARSAKFAAEYYRGLLGKYLELWRAKYGAVTEAKRWNEYLGAADYRTYTQGQRINAEVIDARRMRVHTARNRKLTQIIRGLEA